GARCLDLVASQREQQGGSAETQLALVASGQVFEVVANLIGDAQRLTVVVEHLLRLRGRARERGPDAQGHLERRRRLPLKDVQHLIDGWRGRSLNPGELRALTDTELSMPRSGDPDKCRAHLG